MMDTDDDIGVTVLAADAGWEHVGADLQVVGGRAR